MDITVDGAGHIGGMLARAFRGAGHGVVLAAADPNGGRARALAEELGVHAVPVAEAAARCQVIALAVPWAVLPAVAAQGGDLSGKVVVDATNAFPQPGGAAMDGTAAQRNAELFRPAAYGRAFNTLTAAFQSAQAIRPEADRLAMFYVAEPAAETTVRALVQAVGSSRSASAAPLTARCWRPPAGRARCPGRPIARRPPSGSRTRPRSGLGSSRRAARCRADGAGRL